MSGGYLKIMFEEDFRKLKKKFEECEGDTFEFQGKKLDKGYAKYLIEYLESKGFGKEIK